jgi:hypothetical protein
MTKLKGPDLSAPVPLAGMAGFSGRLFKAYVQGTQAFLVSAFALNQEMLRFAGERFRADMEVLQILPQCANWQDIAELQSIFARSAAETCQGELSKLMERSTMVPTSMWNQIYASGHRIRAIAEEAGLDLSPARLVPIGHSDAVAALPVQMARKGEVLANEGSPAY